MVAEGGKDFACDSAVVIKVFGVDEDVVHVADEFPMADEVSEDVIHHGLECCGGVTQAKELSESVPGQSPAIGELGWTLGTGYLCRVRPLRRRLRSNPYKGSDLYTGRRMT